MEQNMPSCALKCLRNVEDVSQSVHQVKYGVNTIGRGLNNDIVLKNLSVSRTHCHLRVEKKESKDIAYIKDLGTSNGTIVGNINLIEFEEHQLNDLDMIVLASGDEGVVLQYIDQVDRAISISNLCNNPMNNKRKVLNEENVDDESTAVKIPKLITDSDECSILKKPFSNTNTNLSNSNALVILPNVANNLQHSDLNQLTLVDAILKPNTNSDDQNLPIEDPKIIPTNNTKPSCSHYKDNISVKDLEIVSTNNIGPSCSHYKDNIFSAVEIKTEPDTINNILSQGTYRNEEDSFIVVYSSDDENGLELSSNLIEKREQIKLNTDMKQSCPSTSKIENNLNLSEDNKDDLIYIPPNLNSNNISILISSSDSESEYTSKHPKIIDPFPMKDNKRGQTKLLEKNKYIMKTRAKSEKIICNKKKAEEVIVDQNKQIIQERQMRLKKLATNNSSNEFLKIINENPSTNDPFIDNPSTISKLKINKRVSRLEKTNNDNCIPSTSKSHLPVHDVQNQTGFKCQKITSTATITKPINFVFFDTLSKICKWNAVWLYEEKFVDTSPPLVKTIYKMREQFDTPSEYSSTMKSILFYEIWSKISESYHMVLSRIPDLEKCIFEKSSKKNLPLSTFDIQSVNEEFSSSVQALKSISQPLWCLKCIGTNKNIETLSGSRNSLKGCLCIVIVQSECFETNVVKNKKPMKSKSIFFAYVNMAKKIGYHSNSQLYIELIVTKKTENIPNGTHIHLMDIFYLYSELRLFQALNNVTTSSLCKALITPQLHNYSIDSSKANLKNYNINSLLNNMNNSQKEAVKMAIAICNSVEPNVGLIIGPPGTGKTNVICNIILTLMSNKLIKTTTKPKLLVCAPSNEAADVIVRRIIEIKRDLKYETQFDVIRVGCGQKYDPNSPIVGVMLDTIVKQRMENPLNEANRQGQTNNLFMYTNKKELENEILLNAEVIVTTLNSCFSKTMEDTFKPSNINCHFTACIVDEAGQSIEPLIYVPLLLGINKLILVGDDKQLQPLVKSKVAKDNGLGISLFKRLKTWFEHKRSTRKNFPVTMLNTQYRMHNEICLFPSTYFYKGVVKTAPSVKMRKQLPFQPYMILEHESQQDNTGELNIGEAYMIVNLVEILLDSECQSLSIAVLTPYHKQREQINVLLRNKKISINVNTIDSFQGGECDVLLISTVRTNGVGFMDDICRLNVALTRAKQSLIICGNFMSLRGERVWSDLLEDAKKRKLIKKVSKKVITNSRALLAMIRY